MIPDDDESDLPDEAESDVDDAVWVTCPYCGEEVELLIDLGGGETQAYVEDCEVCCRPWSVRVELGGDQPVVQVTTLDDE